MNENYMYESTMEEMAHYTSQQLHRGAFFKEKFR